ncbi:spirocyclase AveC family protein [Nocardia brasiliensis]
MAALLLQAVIFGRWIAAGDIHSAQKNYTISTVRTVLLWVDQAGIAIAIMACVIVAVWQSHKIRAVSFDAAVVFGFAFTLWTSPLNTYHQPLAVSNRAALNISNWAAFIPGWHGASGTYVEGIIAGSGLSYLTLMVWTWAQRPVVAALMLRKPDWGPIRLIPAFMLTGMVVDFLIQILAVPIGGGYAYLIANPTLSLFGGHWYQLPFLASVSGALFAVVPNYMLLRARQQGTTVYLFRGSEHLPQRAQLPLRLLAGVGLCTAILFAYKLGLNLLLPLGAGPIPADTPTWLWPQVG